MKVYILEHKEYHCSGDVVNVYLSKDKADNERAKYTNTDYEGWYISEYEVIE